MTTKSGERLLYEKESYLLRGACFRLYKKFGGAFKEKIIHNAMVAELRTLGLQVATQKRITVVHQGKKVGTYVPDLVINDAVLIELKVKPFLTKEDERQFWYYLRASDYPLGFLINFSPRHLQLRRRIYEKARKIYPR